MSLKRLSPTANLLRTSRLFALPPPLSRPAPDLSAITNFDSDTATTPYPVHAAIETTESSLARGDWGLKRALPLKSTTKSSTPLIHIDNIDSIDHITDFGSAADHSLTLRKWQEIDIPLTIPEKRDTVSGKLPFRSAFDSQYDNTQIHEKEPIQGPAKQRWKYKGPWLAGKSDGDFKNYVEKKVKRRRLDFRQHLANRLAQSKAAAQRREAVERGEDLKNEEQLNVAVSAEEIDAFMRQLRNNEGDLHRLIEEFLDLPREEGRSLGGDPSQYNEKGPPTTHPSAGLSYLRTDSHVYNHPELGPQEYKAPIQGRVIVPQKTGDRTNVQALIGVAGVVGKDSRKTFFQEKNDKSASGLGHFDPDIQGGGKLWTHPKRASVDSRGRIDLTVDRADKNALNVALGVHSEGTKLPSAAIAAAKDREVPNLAPSRPKREDAGSGYGLENLDGVGTSGRAVPFLGPDDEAPEDALGELLRSGMLKPKTQAR